MVLEEGGGHIAINPVFDKLITSLRIAVDIDGKLDKESTSYNDIFEAFRLAMKLYRLGNTRDDYDWLRKRLEQINKMITHDDY